MIAYDDSGEGGSSDRGNRKEEDGVCSFKAVEVDQENDDICDEHRFVGDPIRSNMGNILRIYSNNCNGIQINRLIKTQIKQIFEKKKEKYLGK